MEVTHSDEKLEAPRRVLLVGGSFESWWNLAASLRREGFEIAPVPRSSIEASVTAAAESRSVVLVVDLSLDPASDIGMVEVCRRLAPGIPLIAVTADSSIDMGRQLRQLGVFYLAIHPVGADELGSALASAHECLSSERVTPSRFRTKKILIIDDDPDFARSTAALLLEEGYAVSYAVSGKGGLAKLIDERPDLVILDVMMEHEWAGYEVNQAIKFQSEYSSVQGVPVLMVSSIPVPPEERFRTATEMPMVCPDSYLTKPLDIPTFLGRVRSLLGGAAPDTGAPGQRP